jgi:two-component system sensor histidine kinase HydH
MEHKYSLIFIVIFIFTLFAVFNSISQYKSAKRSSEDILKSTAYFTGITIDQALNRTGIDEELFVDIVKTQPWEEIAYIALYDRNGKILLHSSKRLIGQKTDDPDTIKSIEESKPRSSYLNLSTGETVYGMDIPVNIHSFSPSKHLLRIALHTYPAEEAVQHAKIHAMTAVIVMGFLWVLAFAYFRYAKRIDMLQRKEIEKKHFTMLGEMAAVLAHEIRSPLSAIKGFAQFINEKKEKDISIEEGLGVIIDESQRLESLTEDLLTYSRTGTVKVDKFSLTEVIGEVERLFTAGSGIATIQKSIKLENDMVLSDREKIRHILINILQNAVDSIEADKLVEVNAYEKDDIIFITVKDKGKGMDKEALKHAMDPFFTTKTSGTGLGLAIVYNFVRAINGSVRIESEENKGTTVHLSFERILK